MIMMTRAVKITTQDFSQSCALCGVDCYRMVALSMSNFEKISETWLQREVPNPLAEILMDQIGPNKAIHLFCKVLVCS